MVRAVSVVPVDILHCSLGRNQDSKVGRQLPYLFLTMTVPDRFAHAHVQHLTGESGLDDFTSHGRRQVWRCNWKLALVVELGRGVCCALWSLQPSARVSCIDRGCDDD